jgi:glycosyltransferase involved in cell wall biosynthesis
MIIVDDGSTDKTVSIKKLAARDCRKVFSYSQNVGTGITRNTALYKANGRYTFS